MNYILLLGWLAACALQDAQQRRIANALTLGALAVALLYLIVVGSSLTNASPADAVTGIAVASVLSLPGYLTKRMGAGDVKMLMALGAASDAKHVLFSVIGAALAQVAWLAATRCYPKMLQVIPLRFVFLREPTKDQQPYAPFLCVGLAITVLWIITQ